MPFNGLFLNVNLIKFRIWYRHGFFIQPYIVCCNPYIIDKRIQYFVCGTEKVCFSTTKKTIHKGKFDVFGIKIINVISDEEFSDEFDLNLRVSKLIKGNDEITDSIQLNKIILKYRENIVIDKNNEGH